MDPQADWTKPRSGWKIHIQSHRSRVRLTEPQSYWWNHSQAERSNVILSESQSVCQIYRQADRTTYRLTVSQIEWQNLSQTDRTTVTQTEPQSGRKIHSHTVRITVSLSESQAGWQNHRQTDSTTDRMTEQQSDWQNQSQKKGTLLLKWNRPGFDISKPYMPFTHMLQTHWWFTLLNLGTDRITEGQDMSQAHLSTGKQTTKILKLWIGQGPWSSQCLDPWPLARILGPKGPEILVLFIQMMSGLCSHLLGLTKIHCIMKQNYSCKIRTISIFCCQTFHQN